MTHVSVRTDEARQTDDSAVGEQFRHLGDTTNVLFAVLKSEAEVLVETVTNVVTVETVRRNALTDEVLLEGKGDRRLTGTRKTYITEGGKRLFCIAKQLFEPMG